MCFGAIRGSFPLFCSKAALVVISSVCNEFHDHSFFVVSLKYKFIYFNWRLTALQYCVGFAIHQHESATGIHMFPILKPLPPPSPYSVGEGERYAF